MSIMDQETLDLTGSHYALHLASLGSGLASPNPLVGCAIVSETGDLVGEGTYTFDGISHAEAIALEQAGEKAKNGTAYVNLEPHDHHGKTPPCTEALINAGIKRVVCPLEDPNPLVSGKGFERLSDAGVEVVKGVLTAEAVKLNEKFICWHKNDRPFVHLKLAMSLDGRISLTNSVSTALSGDEARNRVQDLRHEYDAILIGGNTAVADNPSLTDRSDKPRRRKLVRVVLDNRLRIAVESTLVKTARETPTLVISNFKDENKIAALTSAGVEVIRIDARDLAAILAFFKDHLIQSVLVEGGSEVAGAFVDARLVDKVSFITAPILIGGHRAPVAIGGNGAGTLDDAFRLTDLSVTPIGKDIEITGYPS
jgi:diaminohydroxyphosphoribosylaminopyrimidine deaminase/5-amino-6-(5-phosphoribosylamino)uracil reductase